MWKIIDNTKQFSSFIQNLSRIRQEIYKETITKGK